MTFNDSTCNFYTGLQSWDSLKITVVVLNVLIVFIGPFLLYLVIWYERFSSDIMYRTLINQLLSRLCFIEILSCFFSRLSFFSSYCFGPLPSRVCDFSTLLTRYSLFLTMNQITIRQLIKFLYVFKWKYLAGLHADFSAHFLTLLNIVLGLVFTLVSYILGYHNEELDFHICTGRLPIENVALVLKQMGLENTSNNTSISEELCLQIMSNTSSVLEDIGLQNISTCTSVSPVWGQMDHGNISTTSSQGWFEEVSGSDPLHVYVKLICILLVPLVVQIWLCTKIKCQQLFVSFGAATNEKFMETKTSILGTGQTLIFMIFAFFGLLPIALSKSMAKKNIEEINGGTLRTMVYISKVSMPALFFILFPLLTIAFHSNVRKSLLRELRGSDFVKRIFG